MKFFVFIGILLLCRTVFAQFDPDCYYPMIGQEIDTIYGAMDQQQLGRGFDTVPKFVGDTHPRVGTIGLPGHAKEFTTFQTGPDFNLRNLQGVETLGGLDAINYVNRHVRYGHFRSRKYRDMIVSYDLSSFSDTIYWADDSGRYNRERFSVFSHPFTLDSGYQWRFGQVINPSYVAKLTSDSLCDVVITGEIGNNDNSNDKFFLLLYKGSSIYSQGQVAFPDSVLELGNLPFSERGTYVEFGDFRGVGRDDALIYKQNNQLLNNLFFYRNDPPFSLSKFYNSMRYDTLMTAWENKVFQQYNPSPGTGPIISAYKRSPDDPTQDFLLSAETTDERNLSMWLFKGGPDFGSKRLYLDNPSYFFWHPGHYDGTNFMTAIGYFIGSSNMGDMTGTGNPVLCTRGILPIGGQTCQWGFYVLGDAMDDKIDMYFTTQKVGYPIPITADNDNMTDALLGMPFILSDKDKAEGWDDVGSIGLLHGSKKIPVRKNSITNRGVSQVAALTLYPNPAGTSTTLAFVSDRDVFGVLSIWDILGNKVLERKIEIVTGEQLFHISTDALLSGTYLVKVTSISGTRSTTLFIVR